MPLASRERSASCRRSLGWPPPADAGPLHAMPRIRRALLGWPSGHSSAQLSSAQLSSAQLWLWLWLRLRLRLRGDKFLTCRAAPRIRQVKNVSPREKTGGEGPSVPREPAYADERSQDGGAKSASERVEAWRADTSVRRRGMGGPSPAHRLTGSPAHRLTGPPVDRQTAQCSTPLPGSGSQWVSTAPTSA
jgi:hypothetical protein